MVGRRSEAYAGSGPVGVAATGAAGAAGPATTCGAAVASTAGACATGGGESTTGAWTWPPRSAEGAVGGTSGCIGAIGAGGGVAPAAVGNGAPVCKPLSKLCINSPGVTPWAGPVGASGALVRGGREAPDV